MNCGNYLSPVDGCRLMDYEVWVIVRKTGSFGSVINRYCSPPDNNSTESFNCPLWKKYGFSGSIKSMSDFLEAVQGNL
jgi:hypothetical protein